MNKISVLILTMIVIPLFFLEYYVLTYMPWKSFEAGTVYKWCYNTDNPFEDETCRHRTIISIEGEWVLYTNPYGKKDSGKISSFSGWDEQ